MADSVPWRRYPSTAPAAPAGGDLDRRGLTEPLGATGLAINRYALAPGEAFSGGLHAHEDQEELFYVLEGVATFETAPDPTAEPRTVRVEAGEAIRFAPGEYQRGHNAGEDRLIALAPGAPRDSTDVRIPGPCESCGADALAAVPLDEGEGFGLRCPDCGAEFDL